MRSTEDKWYTRRSRKVETVGVAVGRVIDHARAMSPKGAPCDRDFQDGSSRPQEREREWEWALSNLEEVKAAIRQIDLNAPARYSEPLVARRAPQYLDMARQSRNNLRRLAASGAPRAEIRKAMEGYLRDRKCCYEVCEYLEQA